MTILSDAAPKSSPTPADLWPSTPEIDGERWELTCPPGPDPDEILWAAWNLNDAAADYDVEDLDELACVEAAALECQERGLIGPDVAAHIARTSILGRHSEEQVDAYIAARRTPTPRDEAERALCAAWLRLGFGHMA